MLSEGEREQLRARAGELGVSVSRLLVESALPSASGLSAATLTERRALLAGLFECRRLLATVANNVNQLAKAANISGQVATGRRLEQMLEEVDEVLAALRELPHARSEAV